MSEILDNKYQSDIKGSEGKEGFIALVFRHLDKMSFAINNTESSGKDAIVYYNALFIISHVPNKKLSKEYKKQLLQNIEEYEKSGKKHDAAVITASVEIVNEVIIHIDEMIGLETTSKIAVEFDCGSCDYKKRCEEFDQKKKEEKIIVGV